MMAEATLPGEANMPHTSLIFLLLGLCYCATPVIVDGTYTASQSLSTKHLTVPGIALTACSTRETGK
jgi:hypothetical protein